jgi:hypothetical protein
LPLGPAAPGCAFDSFSMAAASSAGSSGAVAAACCAPLLVEAVLAGSA